MKSYTHLSYDLYNDVGGWAFVMVLGSVIWQPAAAIYGRLALLAARRRDMVMMSK